ncbi:MAG: ABC transporter substrate-binding protein [Chloroflexota bacterium]|nr:ABC transporter substrate-binding protein [Chloroflexota bacterium]
MTAWELGRGRRALSRRQFLRVGQNVLILGGLAIGAACSAPAGAPAASSGGQAPAAAEKPSASGAATSTSAGAPKPGGTLRMALGTDVTLLDPVMSGSKLDRQVYHNLYDPLLVLDDKLGIQPNLAESWQTPDPATLILKLRQGVKFHDGTEFNSEAARINFDRMANDPKSVRKGEVANIASTEAVDPLTLKINLKNPDSSLLATLTDRAGMMVSPAAIQKLGADLQHDATGAGTGPFQFIEWIPDDHVVLKRNDAYWNKSGGPYLDQIRYRPIPDDTVKLQSLQGGEIDALDYLAPRTVALAKADSNLATIDVPSLAAFWYMLNTTKPPFDNKALRMAVTYALDAEAIVKGVYLGVGVAANGPISPSSWAYDDTIKPVARDLAKARAMLAEGGRPDGFTFTFTIVNTPFGVQEAEVVKAQLAEAGITCNVQPVDAAGQLAAGNGKTFEMTTYAWSGRPDPDGNTYQFFHTTPGVSLNWSGISNPQLDQLLEQTRQVTDHAERKKLYSQAIQILHDEAPAVFIVHPVEPKAMSPKLQGYTAVPDGMLRFKDVWLK